MRGTDQKKSRNLHVACASDDAFAMPLAVMVRSILDTLCVDWCVHLHVLSGGLSKNNKKKLERSWESSRLIINWLLPNTGEIENLRVTGHVNSLTYFRILLPHILPRDIGRVIYLDSDMLVRKDLSLLWNKPFEEKALLAVQDMTVPVMCASEALEDYAKCGPFLSMNVPLDTYRELSISPRNKYFNAGLMVINLEKWRDEQIAEKIVDYLQKNNERIQFWDQDGLNAVLFDQWGELDLRWNQIPHIFRYPTWELSPFSMEVFAQVRNDPWIIHYASAEKPWEARSMHPLKGAFYTKLKDTEWKYWLPSA